MINEQLENLRKEALTEIKKIKDSDTFKKLKIKYLGRKGQLSLILRDLKKFAQAERPKMGSLANEIKEEITKAFEHLEKSVKKNLGKTTSYDITLPAKRMLLGHLHPLSQIETELEDLMVSLGFKIIDGPELESDYYNFIAVNVPLAHPARDMQDTFFVEDYKFSNQDKELEEQYRLVLRTQTSATQVRCIEQFGAPLRVISHGRVFRYEATDARHETTFDQLEGLMIDKEISVVNLIAYLKIIVRQLFNREIKLRVRPGYFPFVEPGMEVDLECLICQGRGCPVCKKTGWVEMLGCGLVHPNVIKAGGLDPAKWSGFAFGIGITRLAMIKFGINDIRLFNNGDLRFINQF